MSNNWPVFAYAHNLGTVSAATTPVVIAVGHARDPAIEYIIAKGALQARSLYFFSQYSSVTAAVRVVLFMVRGTRMLMLSQITAFLGDYSAALTRAKAFDAKVQSDASAISTDYASIVALSIRQAFGATEITISKKSDGSWNTADVLMFMKGTSSFVHSNVSQTLNSYFYGQKSRVMAYVHPLWNGTWDTRLTRIIECQHCRRHLPSMAYLLVHQPRPRQIPSSPIV